ncbi:uncharacterized protein LOC144021409 [Festucalex cinctus]
MHPTDERKGRSPAPAPTSPLLFPPHNEGTRSCFEPPILISSSPECSDVEENEADVTFLEGPVQRGGATDVSSDLRTSGLYHVVRTAGPYHVAMKVVREDEPIGEDDRPSTSRDCYGGLTSLHPTKEEPPACGSAGAIDDVSGSPGKEKLLLPFTQTLSPINDRACDENSSPVAHGIPAWALSSESSSSIDTPKRPVWCFSGETASPHTTGVSAWGLSNRTASPDIAGVSTSGPSNGASSPNVLLQGLPANSIPPPPPPPRNERATCLEWTLSPFLWVNNARYQCIKQAVSYMLRIAILKYSRKTCDGCFYLYTCRNKHTCFYAPRRPYYFGQNFDAIVEELCNGYFRSTIRRVITITNHPSSDADVRRIVESVLHDYAHERLILDRITTVLASTWDGYLSFAIPDIIRGLCDRDG